MRALAAYIMRGRMRAMAAAVGFMGMSMIFPLLSYLSAATVALVALRLGWRESAVVAGGAWVMTSLITWIALGTPAVGGSFAIVVWVPAIILALVLRQTISLPTTLSIAVIIGALGVLAIHAWIDDPAAWWRDGAIAWIQTEIIDRAGLDAEQATTWHDALDRMADVMTGIMVAAVVISNVLSLLIARWWQSLLYNPGGFQQEFHGLRLGKTMALAALGLMLASMLPVDKVASVSRDIAMVVVLLFMLQGLAVVHALIAKRRASAGWLFGIYGLLVVALPQVTLVLAVTGLMDTWMDFRARVTRKQA